jgi:thiazole/oxazole-forming peptide maturase SagD family component
MKHPVLAGSALVTGGKAVVRLADRNVTIEAPSQVLREIFRLCDGQTALEAVRRKVRTRGNAKSTNRLLAMLIRHGVLVDANQLVAQYWRYVENPRRLGEVPSPHEYRALPFLAAKQTARKLAGSYHRVPRSRFRSLLERRTSTRLFSGRPVRFANMLGMLWAAYGVQARRDRHTLLHGRAVPSGGGIYPLRLTLVNMKKTGKLNAGIYAVHFRNNQSIGFTKISKHWRDVYGSFGDPDLLRRAHGVIIISGDFELTARKYGNRALLYVALEAGHAAQDALLAATEFSVGAIEIGGFLEDQVRALLKLQDRLRPLTTVVFGEKASRRSRPDEPNVTFRWIDPGKDDIALPFHLGMGQAITATGDAEPCWGRARDPLLAYDKAISETVERAACGNPAGVYRVAFADIEHALDPRSVVAYDSRQYRLPRFPFAPFDERRKSWWKDGVDYFSGRKTPVLADLVYFEKAIRHGRASPYTSSSTSGVAAFMHREGALERAVLELIERDAFMYAWLGRGPTPRIPRRFLPRSVQQRVSALNGLGLRVVVKDLTEDLVPVLMVFAQHMDRAFTVIGTAAGYEPEAALEHALMECEATAILRLRGGTAKRLNPSQIRFPSDHADLYAQRRYFRRADFLADGHSVGRLPERRKSVARTWGGLLTRLHEKELRLFFVDVTPPDAALDAGRIPLVVVRAIVPGLVPISFGFRLEPFGMPRVRENASRSGERRRVDCFPHPLT